MLLKHPVLICNNGIFSVGNLIIVVYNQYTIFHYSHLLPLLSYYLLGLLTISYFSLIIAYQINFVFVLQYLLNSLFGSCTKRYAHSRLYLCIHIGARLIFSA